MAFKIGRTEKYILKQFASTLAPYPRMDNKGNLIKGKSIQVVNWKKGDAFVNFKDIYIMEDPYKFLMKVLKRFGPKALPEATRTYQSNYREAIKKLIVNGKINI